MAVGSTYGDPMRSSLPVRVLTVVVVALLAGAVTSYGQSHLPDQLRSFANSSGSWCALAYVLALVGRRPGEGVAYGVLSLVALVSGYYAMSHLRTFGVGLGPVLFWMLAAVTAGPALGLGAQWLHHKRGALQGMGVGVLPGVLIGEGSTALATVGDTTHRGYWVASIIVGVGLLIWLGSRRLSSASGWAAAAGTAVVVSVLFAAVYVWNPIALL